MLESHSLSCSEPWNCCMTGGSLSVFSLLNMDAKNAFNISAISLLVPTTEPLSSINYFLKPSVSISEGGFKNWWKWLKGYHGYDAQSVQSGTDRLSCSRTALKCCTSTETRWYKITSLSGVTRNWGDPPAKIIQKPNGWRTENAQGFNSYWFKHVMSNNARVLCLLASGRPILLPPLPLGRLDSARGQDTVTSQQGQHNDLPLCHGTSVRLSGLFPSDRNNPMGSLVTGTRAEAKLRAIKSLRAWCALLHYYYYDYYYYWRIVTKMTECMCVLQVTTHVWRVSCTSCDVSATTWFKSTSRPAWSSSCRGYRFGWIAAQCRRA